MAVVMRKRRGNVTYIEPAPRFHVVHPLDDEPEEKCRAEGLAPLRMTPAVRISLMALRGYLIVMALLVLYHALTLAKVF